MKFTPLPTENREPNSSGKEQHSLIVEYRKNKVLVRDFYGPYFSYAEMSIGDDLEDYGPLEDYPEPEDRVGIWVMEGLITGGATLYPSYGIEYEYALTGSCRPATTEEIEGLDSLDHYL